MSVKRVHAPRGKLNVGDKKETVLIEGDVKLRLHNRFIHVGVDISSYTLLTGGWSLYLPVLVKFLYSRGYSGTLVITIGVCVCVDYPRHGHVLRRTIIIKTCVLLLLLLIHTFSVLSLQLKKLR